MRLLVICGHCRRQFDASGRAVGSRFRCPCGSVVSVRRPRAHDADVVHCAACGAPRQGGASACGFCGSDFTLHEQDLETVCPVCLTRVSDKARFCHHCGQGLMPEPVVGEPTGLTCPACRRDRCLSSRQMGPVSVIECSRCSGLWLGHAAFRLLADRAQHFAGRRDPKFDPAMPERRRATADDGHRYRACVVCRQPMHRRHYGYASGVIVDLCRDHGIWFDADELRCILDFLRTGEAALGDSTTALELRPAKPSGRRASTEPLMDRPEDASLLERFFKTLNDWISDD